MQFSRAITLLFLCYLWQLWQGMLFCLVVESILIEISPLEGYLQIDRRNDQPMEIFDRKQAMIMTRDDNVDVYLSKIAEFDLIEVI